MPRFFADKNQITENAAYITGEDVKHISRVLRLRSGDEITVCDKAGNDYICQISEISTDRVVASVLEKKDNMAESEIHITLYQGMPKSDKMDYIVQKCVELGVSRVVPVITKRAVSRPSDGDKKVLRWQKIAEEAAKQSGRGIVPEIGQIMSFEEAVATMNNEDDTLNIMPYECEKDNGLRNLLKMSGEKKKVNVLIGPEGGFDDMEAAIAKKKGVSTVSLGPRIMRTETAPLAVVAVVMYELGDW